jgi:hypothetical protein
MGSHTCVPPDNVWVIADLEFIVDACIKRGEACSLDILERLKIVLLAGERGIN